METPDQPMRVALFSSTTGEPTQDLSLEDYSRLPLDMLDGTTARLFVERQGVRLYIEDTTELVRATEAAAASEAAHR